MKRLIVFFCVFLQVNLAFALGTRNSLPTTTGAISGSTGPSPIQTANMSADLAISEFEKMASNGVTGGDAIREFYKNHPGARLSFSEVSQTLKEKLGKEKWAAKMAEFNEFMAQSTSRLTDLPEEHDLEVLGPGSEQTALHWLFICVPGWAACLFGGAAVGLVAFATGCFRLCDSYYWENRGR